MDNGTGTEGRSRADACAGLRAAVVSRCEEARGAKAAHSDSLEHIRELRRNLFTARHKQTEAETNADPSLRTAAKATARQTYERARQLATSDDEQRAATAAWADAVDRINRTSRLSQRAVSKARVAVRALEGSMRGADQAEYEARSRAATSESGCLDARVRLAACEEDSGAAATPGATASVFEPHAATGGHAAAITLSRSREPLVIESMVSGDRVALDLAAELIGDQTGIGAHVARLQLQELVSAVVSAASEEGFLVFDTTHSFWSALTFEEARDVVAALARLGFAFEPTEGWNAGRAPTPSDLSMALAYAGLDSRNMRDLPSSDDLRALPESISVDARAFLVARAPELSLERIVPLLGRRASQLEPLWNEWGQVRPALLGLRRNLGRLHG